MKKIISVILITVLCAALCTAVSAEKDPDVWLCAESADGSYVTGWWIGTAIDSAVPLENWVIYITFSAPGCFDGFDMACYADANDPAVLSVSLLDEEDNELEGTSVTVVGDHENLAEGHGYITVWFDNVYAAGDYTIKITITGGYYFVLGSGNTGTTEVSMSGLNGTNPNTLYAPAIKLLGAEIEEEDQSDESVSEPDESEPESEEETGKKNDIDGDGEVNNKDVVYLFRYVSEDPEYSELYDVNGDNEVNNKDVVTLFRTVSL